MLKTCVTCDEFNPETENCHHKAREVTEPVYGKRVLIGLFKAATFRKDLGVYYCCPQGRFWVPIHSPRKSPFNQEG